MTMGLILPLLSAMFALYVGAIAAGKWWQGYSTESRWKKKSYAAQALGLGVYAFYFISGCIYFIYDMPVPASITNWSSYAGILMITGIYCSLRSETKKVIT